MDTTRLATYSEAYLQELRANAVKRVDAARFLVARGAIGGTRMHAMKDIEAGRAERDAIDVELAKRVAPRFDTSAQFDTGSLASPPAEPDEVRAVFVESIDQEDRVLAPVLEADDDLMIDPPEVPRRSPEIRKPKR
jgi:hypothetical protein